MMRNTHAGRSDTDNIVGGIFTRVAITTMIMMMMFAIDEIPWNRFFVLVGSSYPYEKLPSMDGFLRMVIPPGHVIMTSFPYLYINCDYGDLSVYGVHRTDRSIRPEKRLLCEGSDLLPLLWIIVVITAFSMGHSNFCKGCGLEAIILFYLIFTILFLWLVGCFHFVGLSVVVWGWGLLLFVLFCLYWLRFFYCCFLFVLLLLVVDCFGIFFFRLYRDWGHSWYVQLCNRLCIYYVFIYDFLRWCWYCCILILRVKIGMNVRVSVPDTMTYVVTYVCLSRLAWMCEWVYTMTHCMSYNLSTCQYSCIVFSLILFRQMGSALYWSDSVRSRRCRAVLLLPQILVVRRKRWQM